MAEDFKTDDAKLAAYLCLRGYDTPQYDYDGKVVKYIFQEVVQQDVLDFYNKLPISISPLAIFEKHTEILACGKIAALKIPTEVFQQVS